MVLMNRFAAGERRKGGGEVEGRGRKKGMERGAFPHSFLQFLSTGYCYSPFNVIDTNCAITVEGLMASEDCDPVNC